MKNKNFIAFIMKRYKYFHYTFINDIIIVLQKIVGENKYV